MKAQVLRTLKAALVQIEAADGAFPDTHQLPEVKFLDMDIQSFKAKEVGRLARLSQILSQDGRTALIALLLEEVITDLQAGKPSFFRKLKLVIKQLDMVVPQMEKEAIFADKVAELFQILKDRVDRIQTYVRK